ncbi:PIG-L family deacetylase [Pedobacter cryotolerans]|uniref:PIG-L family deacetylase n=1 Tax=Pedobacter cryotolerans TaxID=2571270 RepID=A0A4U1CEM8_9SPHI|nr:PIG-L family deacetylase [Pedobacter cryotolerans]TKC03300.1 PIG-L family deacetylase [Pedobacter cryotolerans]
MNRYYFLLITLLFPIFLNAQMQQMNAADIALGIEKLNVKGSVLYIAAHPDDENTRLLAYLAKEAKVSAGYLSLTRGDGGQNLIGNEQAELLGLIRTQELLAARKVDGAEQFFTRANDFGFSKTADESFKIWGKEQILADVVWVIRKFRPDVIITRFPEDSRAGHGHHAGSGILAREAFTAAADPKRFPEQLAYVKVWQAKRLLWNTFNFGGTNTTAPDQLKIDVGLYNPLVGKSYGEIAAISRTNHKSQGFGSTLQRGEAFEFFSHVAGEPAKNSIFDGINTTLNNPNIQAILTEIRKNFDVKQPDLILPHFLKLKKATQGIDFNHQLLDDLILASAGIWIEANTPENVYAIGDIIPVRLQAIARTKLLVSIATTDKTMVLSPNRLSSSDLKLTAEPTTQPYWLQENHPIGQYLIDKQELVGNPENTNQLSVKLSLSIDNQPIELNTPVVFKSTDPIVGERYQPLVIAPAVTATLSEKAYIFNGNAPKTITVSLKSFKNNAVGFLVPKLPKGWKSNTDKIDFNLPNKGDEQIVSFTITPGTETSGNLNLQVSVDGKIDDKGVKNISYAHIPNITIFPQATARLEKIDLKIAGKNIAYIDGAGDLVPEALKEMGYAVTKLTPAQILATDLANYDAIVTGVRLYNINADVKLIQPKLLKYVENGGTLLIQYNVNNGLKTTSIGPYPFKLANKRVTEEDAKVNFLVPNSPALNYPNKITAKDFEGWVQERGLYFATDIDQKYSKILSMNDTGETANDGSLLIADYGKGKFVYTSLVFFRELPAGVPGAYRLFANLLAPKQR